ncbi:MAG: twin-arginine translocase TatA/TatE family subunit [Syntrophobacter sp.]
MIGSLGIGKIVVILFVLVLLFGGRKLPGLGAGIGKAIRNFKKETKDMAG